jgi:DNA polymerase-4
MEVYVSFTYREEGWSGSVALGQCQDTLSMIQAFNVLWRQPPPGDRPTQVAVTLHKLIAPGSAGVPLFPDERNRVALSKAMDAINDRFGPDKVYFAGMAGMEEAAPTRIAFSHVPEIDDRLRRTWSFDSRAAGR